MICIEPLGTGVILPALLIGYEVSARKGYEQLDGVLPDMGPIVAVFQQAGGYCMRYPTVVGMLLRLEANDGNGTRPFGELVRGLKAMAEDPDLRVLQEYPMLRGLVGTAGEPYARPELDRLGNYVRRFFDVPPLTSGIEALVQFDSCDPLSLFGGWNVLSCCPVPEDRRGPPLYPALPGHHFEQGNLCDLTRNDERVLDEDLLRETAEIGRRLGEAGPPAVFLLWENCD